MFQKFTPFHSFKPYRRIDKRIYCYTLQSLIDIAIGRIGECLASSSVSTTGNQRRPFPRVFRIVSEAISFHDFFFATAKVSITILVLLQTNIKILFPFQE